MGPLPSKELGQIAGQSQPGHLSAVTVDIVGSPSRLNRMQVVHGECGCEEPMTPIDTGIEQADMGHLVAIWREAGSGQQVVEPLTLLFGTQGIKEICRFLGPSQFGNAVEREDGALHLFGRSAHQKNGAFRENQLSRRGLHPLRLGQSAEGSDHNLPLSANR